MKPDITIHSETFKIRASEVGAKGKATLPAICSLFQEVAGNHALMLNFDISQLQEQQLTWVLHRMNIKMERYPDWREEITIETWPAAGDSLRAFRDYKVVDADGIQIGCCLNYWMMINLETRRPVRMPKEVLDMRLSGKDHVMKVKTNRLQSLTNPTDEKTFTVRNSDLDMNNHLNNARYIEWMLASLSSAENIYPRELDIIFIKESYAGDEIISQAEATNSPLTRHQLINQDDKLIALGEVIFT